MLGRLTPARSLLAAGLLVGALAAGCGDNRDEEGLLFASRAEELRADLDALEEAVAEGECARVPERLDALRSQIAELPARTDDRLTAQLAEGVAHLTRIAPEECAENAEAAEPDPTETQPPEPTETQPPEPTQTQPPPTETQPPAQTQPPPDQQPGEDQEGGAGDEGGGGVPAPEGSP